MQYFLRNGIGLGLPGRSEAHLIEKMCGSDRGQLDHLIW